MFERVDIFDGPGNCRFFAQKMGIFQQPITVDQINHHFLGLIPTLIQFSFSKDFWSNHNQIIRLSVDPLEIKHGLLDNSHGV